MDNVDIARILNEVADLLELDEANPFRVRAYRTAARTIESHGEPLAAMVARDPAALTELPGIGKDLAGKIVEILSAGDVTIHRDLVAKFPATLLAMMRVVGVGPKRARRFYDELGLKTLDDLERAARSGRLRTIRGVGRLLEGRILQGCTEERARSSRWRLADADAHAAPLLTYLRALPEVQQVDVAGSLRRRRDTIGDIDVLVAAATPTVVADRFVKYPEVTSVIAKGATKCSVRLRSGMQADLRIVAPETYGAALHYFTGSKAHNIAIRTLGVRRRLKISEYGVFRGTKRVGGRTEEDIFRAVGLPWIPPELREGQGELEAAKQGRLPNLIELTDLRGDLHMHTDASDGSDTLRAMVEGCAARGYEYLAITDHSSAVRVAGGLDSAGFRRQRRAIDALRKELHGITLLHGAEVDILESGELDLDEETLAALDVVVVAVHSQLSMSNAEMTRRVIKAISHPHVNILAHPTGRLLGKREPVALDMSAVAAAARERGVLLEINAQRDRLDLSDSLARMAREAGAGLVINTDAHRVSDLDGMRYGVDQARRAWCASTDVANTRSLDALLTLLHAPRPAATTRDVRGPHRRTAALRRETEAARHP